MAVNITLSEQTVDHLKDLPLGDDDADSKVRALLKAEYRRQWTRNGLADRAFQEKYGMTLDEFEARRVVEQKGFTWEVESDASEWELAVSGINALRRKLAELLGKAPDEDRYNIA